MAFKEQEVAKFRANCKRAFQKRIDLYMAEEDKGEAKMSEIRRQKTLKQKKDMDTNHSYDFGFPDELSEESCSLSKTIVLTLMIITIILLCMYLGGFFLTEAEKQELQDFADQ